MQSATLVFRVQLKPFMKSESLYRKVSIPRDDVFEDGSQLDKIWKLTKSLHIYYYHIWCIACHSPWGNGRFPLIHTYEQRFNFYLINQQPSCIPIQSWNFDISTTYRFFKWLVTMEFEINVTGDLLYTTPNWKMQTYNLGDVFHMFTNSPVR